MSYYSSEQDPLLPKGSKAPEITCSRPESLNDGSYLESHEELEEAERPQRALSDLVSLIFGLCLILGFAIILLPDDFLDGLLPKPIPTTINQRVTKILADTPLIGKLSNCSTLTS